MPTFQITVALFHLHDILVRTGKANAANCFYLQHAFNSGFQSVGNSHGIKQLSFIIYLANLPAEAPICTFLFPEQLKIISYHSEN